MSDFDSLKADQSFAGELLRSAAADAPSARARRLAAASLGMVATTSVVPSAIAAGQALGATTTQVVAPVGVKSISAVLVAKWLASSFVVGVAASSSAITAYEVAVAPAAPAPHATSATFVAPRATAAAVDHTPRRPVLAPNVPDRDIIPPPPVPAPSRATSSDQAAHADQAAHTTTEAASSPPNHPARAIAPGAVPVADPAASEQGTSLDQEIAWLEPARRALQARDGHGALAAVEQATPHVRLLASEAALMRVEALLLVGRRAEAERLAQPFLERHSSSPHAQRLRQMLGRP